MVAICPNPFRDSDLTITRRTAAFLHEAGFQTAICPVFSEEEPELIPADISVCKLSEIAGRCTLVVVIGGDGTILSVARTLHGYTVPILGINLGTKGFMAALEVKDLPLVVNAAKGELTLSRRMKLDVELMRAGKTVYTDCALNDVVIHGYGDCIKLTACCDGNVITAFSGDGIILSTPTGSTGYSMSAGGPIVEPCAENIILSPICAHAMGVRSFVLSTSHSISVKTEKLHVRRAYLSVDGNSVYDMANEDILVVKRSSHYTLMADMGLRSFYDIAYEKLT